MKTILRNVARYKRILQNYYTGICTVMVKESQTDETTHKTRPQYAVKYEDVPCRLSHESKSTSQAYIRNTVSQTIMLFLDNELEIQAGSKIVVTQDNVTNTYAASSEPNVFETHQQIELELWEDWSGKGSKRSSQAV